MMMNISDADIPVRLSLVDYMEYLRADNNSRCIYEGEEVLHAGHLILCGQREGQGQIDELRIFALCLQTTALTSNPHEITGTFCIDANKAKIRTMVCSCKAGNGGRCKHISATLLWCTKRNDLCNIEVVSQTDIGCVWAQQKHAFQEKYKPMPVRDMPCIKKAPTVDVHVNEMEILNSFIEFLPTSALSKHSFGRTVSSSLDVKDSSETDDLYCKILLDHSVESILMLEVSSSSVELMACCQANYKNLLEEGDPALFIKSAQRSALWHNERKYRVTGSRCYDIYTCRKSTVEGWKTVSLKYFSPVNIKNKYTRHGIQFEDAARRAFVRLTEATVREFGMVSSTSNPWLGFSPDGVIFDGHKPVALLEIKCLYEGKTSTILQAMKSAKFLTCTDDNNFELKKRHQYYGQINLGMSLLNLNVCYLALYASYDNSLHILRIPHDYEFSKLMLTKVKLNFLGKMWHNLCSQV